MAIIRIAAANRTHTHKERGQEDEILVGHKG
jgi:hypothetical protein